jgi:hypothetical protein
VVAQIFTVDPTARYAMKKVQAARQPIAAAIALVALVLTFAMGAGGSAARADNCESDFLVLNPERE